MTNGHRWKMLLLEPDGNHLIPNKMVKSKVMDIFYWFHITK